MIHKNMESGSKNLRNPVPERQKSQPLSPMRKWLAFYQNTIVNYGSNTLSTT